MDSWWQLGEGSGFRGADLDRHRIACPFCGERGNFEVAFHEEKKKPNSRKKLNFDTLKCGNCAGFVMVLWSATEHGSANGIHDYRVLPWPLKADRYPDAWPETVGRYWLQAKRSLADENLDAAAVMARSALQAALRARGASGSNLQKEMEDLASRGELPPSMREWSDEVRLLGNNSAHPAPGQDAPSAQDVQDLVRFLDLFLECAFSLPRRIELYRQRAQGND